MPVSRAVLDRIAPALRIKTSFHVVGIVSTVMPGTCERIFKTRLETLTGKICGRDFGLLYNPEFVALGSVIHDFLHPGPAAHRGLGRPIRPDRQGAVLLRGREQIRITP